MAKKILLLLSFVFCLQFAVAQTMSDEQIIQFVISEQEKGTSQNAIATKLVQRGVSPNRLLELKNKFESTFLLNNMDLMNLASNLAFYELLGDVNLINQEVAKYRALTAEQIQIFAQKTFVKENCSILYYKKNG